MPLLMPCSTHIRKLAKFRRGSVALATKNRAGTGSCPCTIYCAALRYSYKITLYSPLNTASFVTHAEL